MRPIRWRTNDWSVTSITTLERSSIEDPLVRELTERAAAREISVTCEEFLAQARSSAGGGTVAADVELAAADACIVMSRHPTGAVRFHQPEYRAADAGRETTRVAEFLIRLDASGNARALGSSVRLFLFVFGPIVDRVIARLAHSWEEAQWRSADRHRGWVTVDPQRLAVKAPLQPIDPAAVAAAFREDKRILLLIHGILSDAETAFRGLALPSDGPSLFSALSGRYDHILAFNHSTISETPQQNATDLLACFEGRSSAAVDVITHSRGGLVFRAASELAAASGQAALAVQRAVLVASPNDGSPLAAPERLINFLNAVANLAEMFPATPLAHGISFVAEAVVWVAHRLPQALPAIEDLAPNSDFVRAIQHAPLPTSTIWTIGANYEPIGNGWQRLVDAGVDEVFGTSNDLVVPTAGSWNVDGAANAVPVSRIASYGRGGNVSPATGNEVIHTNYFYQRETIDLIARAFSGRSWTLRGIDPHSVPPWRGSAQPPGGSAARTPHPSPAVQKPDAAASAPATMAQLPSRSDSLHLMLLPSGKGHQLVARYRNAFVTENFVFARHPNRKGSLASYHDQIRQFVLGDTSARMPSSKELLQYGQLLFETLFPGEVRRLYDVARSIDRTRALDVVFVSTLDQIADIPWEFAWDPSRRSYLATDVVNFTRNVFTPVPGDPITPTSSILRILVVSAQPLDHGFLSIDQEEEVILSGFLPLIETGLAEVKALRGATPDVLHRYLEMGRWDIVHFIGHGVFDNEQGTGCLLFEDEGGGEHRVPTDTLRSLFCRAGVKLVFLNACESGRGALADYNRGVAPGLMAGGVPAVVANQYAVLDHSATAFARRFYWSIAHGACLGDAAREARIALNYQIHGEAIDWAVPVLFTRDPSDRLCAPREAASIASTTINGSQAGRRGDRTRIRFAFWDVNGVMPGLKELAAQMSAAQSRFSFEVVRITAPLGTWRQTLRADDGSSVTAYLDANEVERRIGTKSAELGVDYLFCITTLPLSDGKTFNLYQWDSEPSKLTILSVSDIFPKIAEARLSRNAAVINATVGTLSALTVHEDGKVSCPMHFNPEIDVAYLGSRMSFDEICEERLEEGLASGVVTSADLNAIRSLMQLT
ncbi:MAG TPA: CHAT domain-containing protein [Thermoanaerobaculia bacterium]